MHLPWVVLLILILPAAPPARLDGSTPWKRSSSTLAITADGASLLVVNPDSNSITLVDTTSSCILAELSVGVNPRSVAVSPDGTAAYVANEGSNSLSIVNLAALSTTAEIAVGDRPVGVAISPDGRLVAVAELGDDRVRFLDTTSLTTLSVLAVADRPHGLTFTPDGQRLLISHLLSGDVTILTIRPFVLYLPLILRGADGPIHRSQTARYASGNMQRAIHITSRAQSLPTWPNIAPAPAVVVNADGTRAYLPQTMANGLGLNTQFDTTVFPKVSVLNLETENHQTSEHISLPETDQPVGLPWDVALACDDTELWVVNAASNDVSVVDISDPEHPSRAAHVPVGDNPRGIVLSPDGGTAYVNNALAGTVSVIDASTYAVTEVITVTDIPLPPTLLNGKRLYHSSARSDLAQAAWISCNTCHVEGEHDGRTWLLQYIDPVPPGATPIITRNTTTLLGMIETYPLRWSAEWDESADSEFSIRFEQFGTGLISGEMHPTLGPPNQGRSYDLDCLAAFIDSLSVPDRTHMLTPAELRGKAVFESPETDCARCHPAPLYTDLRVHDVGTADAYGEWFGPLLDTPTLRFLYDSAPYLHDGSAATLHDVLTTANPGDEHGVTSHLTAEQIEDLVAFLLALPYGTQEENK
jgi:YVTN family beta-propeller protein